MKYLIMGLLFVGGIALAGSEGLLWPLPNAIGVGCIIAFVIMAKGESKF